jgi:hypothetical protein
VEKEVAGLPSTRDRQPILGPKLNFLSLFCEANRQKRVFLYFIFLVDFKHWRKHKKIPKKQILSQEDFAKKSSVKYTTLTKIEIGVTL